MRDDVEQVLAARGMVAPWVTQDGVLRIEGVQAVYAAICAGQPAWMGLADLQKRFAGEERVHGNSDRRVDRALKLLKYAGLVRYLLATREWVAT